MQKFKLNTILDFNDAAPHPSSKIVGIDHYDFNADDGVNRKWQSYTLVPVNKHECAGQYERWYVVDLPEMGLSFVTTIDEQSMPKSLTIDDRLSGTGISTTDGDAEMGAGQIQLVSYWDETVDPKIMYAMETFDDGSVMYFKTVPLVGLKTPHL